MAQSVTRAPREPPPTRTRGRSIACNAESTATFKATSRLHLKYTANIAFSADSQAALLAIDVVLHQ